GADCLCRQSCTVDSGAALRHSRQWRAVLVSAGSTKLSTLGNNEDCDRDDVGAMVRATPRGRATIARSHHAGSAVRCAGAVDSAPAGLGYRLAVWPVVSYDVVLGWNSALDSRWPDFLRGIVRSLCLSLPKDLSERTNPHVPRSI